MEYDKRVDRLLHLIKEFAKRQSSLDESSKIDNTRVIYVIDIFKKLQQNTQTK